MALQIIMSSGHPKGGHSSVSRYIAGIDFDETIGYHVLPADQNKTTKFYV